ncbi:MAG TPA: hypothetical protein VK709_11430 [Candidatus Saccharimonadales bacterium]|jgi:hypothetical protein|nr:hypothetical protein [Candidatus Saccharimonadales bacterium]
MQPLRVARSLALRALIEISWIISIVLVATTLISPTSLAAQVSSLTPQEPATLGEIFRVDQSTGAPSVLEQVKVKQQKVGQTRSGIFQPRENLVDFYIEGAASTAAFKAAESQRFVIRLMSPEDKYGRELNAEEVRKHIVLTRLVVRNVKSRDERLVSQTSLPFEIQAFGKLTTGLDPKKPDRAAQSFLITPKVALTPGEYLISMRGTHNFELIANGLVGNEDLAFRITDH